MRGAVDKQKTGAFIALFCDRELHKALCEAGHIFGGVGILASVR
jgi:hypothetical protein